MKYRFHIAKLGTPNLLSETIKMKYYLETKYTLGSVSRARYRENAETFAGLQWVYGLEGALSISAPDYPELANHIILNSIHLQEAYGEGGGLYAVAFGVGLLALKQSSYVREVKRPVEAAWDEAMARERELAARPAVRTLEAIGGLGLLEVREVNSGYVDGYQETFDTPKFSPFLGCSGLGALHAHDLLHFASARE